MDNNLAQAIRNRIAQYRQGILRAEGAINELANVLATIEGGGDVVGAEAGGGAVGDGGHSGPVAAIEGAGADGNEGGSSGGADEGCTQGTDGGAA